MQTLTFGLVDWYAALLRELYTVLVTTFVNNQSRRMQNEKVNIRHNPGHIKHRKIVRDAETDVGNSFAILYHGPLGRQLGRAS